MKKAAITQKNVLISRGVQRRQIAVAAALAAASLGGGDPLYFANDQGSNNIPGEIYLANAARFTEANFSEPLTSYAIGWKDPGKLEELLEFVAPKVPTSRRFEFAKATNAEEFLSETDDVRGIGADFKRIEYTADKQTGTTLNKGLTIRVDMDNVTEQPNWREQYTGRIMRRLLRNECRRGIALIDAAATAIGNQAWSTNFTLDPDQTMGDQMIAFQDAAGIAPSRGLIGHKAWQYRRRCFRAQNTAGGFASAGMKEQEVADFLGLDAIFVSRERYQSSAAAKTKIVGDSAYLFFAEANQTNDDPSNVKRFVSPTLGGTPFRVYEQQINAKLIDITVEHYSNIVVTSTLGIQKIPVV